MNKVNPQYINIECICSLRLRAFVRQTGLRLIVAESHAVKVIHLIKEL
jgi:hypothetical protein